MLITKMLVSMEILNCFRKEHQGFSVHTKRNKEMQMAGENNMGEL